MTPTADSASGGDPLVSIVPARLEAALKQRGTSVKALAQEIGVQQQTLSAIVRSEPPRTCRLSVRSALAEALDYPEEWLAGEIDWEPSQPWRQEPVGGGGKGPRPVGLAGYRDSERDRLAGLADYQLCCWELSRRVLKAWQRDREEGREGAEEAWQAREAGPWFSEGGLHVVSAVDRILDVAWWDRVLRGRIEPRDVSLEVSAGRDAEQTLAERQNAFAVRAARAIEDVLGPWFEGRRPMNYLALTEVFEWVEGGMEAPGAGLFQLFIKDEEGIREVEYPADDS